MNVKHKIYVRRKSRTTGGKEVTPLIKRCIRMTLHNEGVNVPCEINVYLTDDEEIQEINRNFRELDEPTDVISFPMLNLIPGQFSYEESDLDPDTGLLALGDMTISVERAERQAPDYGRSSFQEIGYLAIHSTLHMLGYDHAEEDERAVMRSHEDAVAEMMKTVLS